MKNLKTYEGWNDFSNNLSALKGNIKTEINARRLKVGDIFCRDNPKDIIRPTLTIVLEKRVNSRKRKVCKVFNTELTGAIYPSQTPEYVARGKKIFKIEDIGDENVGYILKQMTNDAWRISMHKNLLDNIIDIWSKRCPKVVEILDDINMGKEAEKYNI